MKIGVMQDKDREEHADVTATACVDADGKERAVMIFGLTLEEAERICSKGDYAHGIDVNDGPAAGLRVMIVVGKTPEEMRDKMKTLLLESTVSSAFNAMKTGKVNQKKEAVN